MTSRAVGLGHEAYESKFELTIVMLCSMAGTLMQALGFHVGVDADGIGFEKAATAIRREIGDNSQPRQRKKWRFWR